MEGAYFLTCALICVVCVDSCGRENVSGVEGGNLILRVHQTGIRSVVWGLVGEPSILATRPGEPIDDTRVTEPYKGRVSSEIDGSLHIYNLSLQDQRIYIADIYTTGGAICRQFNLTVYERLSLEDIHITHTITSNDPCSLGLLCSMDKRDKRDVTITWSKFPSSDINVTRGVLYVPPSGVNKTYICTASNPVSAASMGVIPWEYCKPKPGVLFGTKNISGLVGKEVTLAVDFIDKIQIQDIQWVKNGVNFATTKPNREVTIRETRYNGRLRSKSDGSLVIHNLAMQDQGDYKADVVMLNLENYEMVYSLHISEERNFDRTHTAVVINVILVLAALVAGVTFWTWRQKRSRKKNKIKQESSDPVGHAKTNDEDSDSEFHDAQETQPEATKRIHTHEISPTPHIQEHI